MTATYVSGLIVTDAADHFGIFYIDTDKLKSHSVPSDNKYTRIMSDRNIDIFRHYLDQTDFTPITHTKCPNEAYDKFMDLYKTAFESAFPLKQRKANKLCTKREPCVTTGLLTSLRTQSKLFSTKINRPTQVNITTYKMYVNLYNKLKRTLKINYYKEKLEASKHDSKQMWSVLKKAIGKQNDKRNISQSFKINNQDVTNKTEIAEAFNSYFSQIGSSTSHNVPKSKHTYSEYLSTPTANSMFLEDVELVMAFLDSNNILFKGFKHQYGFRAKHSTIHPIIHLLNDCAEANNNNPKKFTMSIFCDLSKAFDVISHKIILQKLNFYGLRGVVNDWFSSYLTNRTQYVEINNNKSGVEYIKCGMPQGSILGPLLYLLYVNDISKSTQGHILSFADDTSMYISDSNIENLYRRANIAMDDLYDWFCANRLSLNPKKTKFIVIKPFQRHYYCTNLSVCVNNVPLMQIGSSFGEKSTKFLGIHIDESLSWRHHVNYVNNKISRALYAIKQVKHFLPIESLHTLYFAFIQPYNIVERKFEPQRYFELNMMFIV